MAVDDRSVVLGPREGKTVPVPGHTITHKVVSADTNGAFSVLEVDLFGDGPPRHIHKTEDEAFYILESEVNLLVGERTIRAAAGSFFRTHPQGDGSHHGSERAETCQVSGHLLSSRT